MAIQRKPTGAITQHDPGVYRDSAGGYFSGTSMDNAQYLGDNPAALGGAHPPPLQPGGGDGNAQGPRDLKPPSLPATLTPQPSAQGGNPPQAAPSRPDVPTPVAAQPPSPFTPMPSTMTPTQTVSSQQMGDLSPIVRRGLVPGSASGPSNRLLGKAGGLLGGGLGVPGLGGGGAPDDIGTLIAQLFKTANR